MLRLLLGLGGRPGGVWGASKVAPHSALVQTCRFYLLTSLADSPAVVCSLSVPLSFATGRHLHAEHAADERRRLGAGTARARQPAAAAQRHDRLPAASRPHGEPIRAAPASKVTHSVPVMSSYLTCVCVCVSQVNELDQLNIIHVTGTKGKVSCLL